MSKLGTVYKQPGEFESYTVNYEDDLATGDSVVSATSSLSSPTGLTISDVTVANPRVRFWAAGGVDDVSYKVTITSTTLSGRILEDEVTIKVEET